MLWIDLDRIVPPATWAAASERAKKRLTKAADRDARKALLDSGSGTWGIVKSSLELVSNRKCWYCDSVQDRSYLTIDHYRPKGRLKDVVPDHEGYWWLAFDLNNYRLACINCNSPSRDSLDEVRGKRNFFPVLEETRRLRAAGGSRDDEVPLILDPTIASDVPLLFFDADGYVHPNPRLCVAGSLKLLKAKTTIELLNLNQPGIRDRRKMLYRRMKRDFDRAVRCFDGFVAEDESDSASFEEACEALKESVAEYADLASSARAFMRAWRSETGLAQEVLDAVL